MKSLFRGLLVSAIAASLLLPATAIAKPNATRHPRIVVYAKHPPKPRWHGYGFLPGYRQPPYIAEWRDRSARYRGPYEPYEPRYWYNGQLRYGWGEPVFYRGRWTGGSFGPCWTSTPIGMMPNCGQ